jgi:GntR family transcriptional regulator
MLSLLPDDLRGGWNCGLAIHANEDIGFIQMKDPNESLFLPLDRMSGVPLYYQIQQRLIDQVRRGELKPGEPISSTQEIAARLNVSPMTARQAIKAMCDLGFIYSRQGKGTFVSEIKHEKDFRQVLSFTEEMLGKRSVPSSKVLSFRVQPGSQAALAALGLSAGQKVCRLRRVRYSNALPMGIECSCLPLQIFPDLVETFDPASSLYLTLARKYGIQIAITDEVVEVGKATAEEAQLLRIAIGSPVFLFARTSYLEEGTPVEYVESTYRGDRYKIVNRLTRANRDLRTTKDDGISV